MLHLHTPTRSGVNRATTTDRVSIRDSPALAMTFTAPRAAVEGESARLQLLAARQPSSAALVDAHWMASWLAAFAAPGASLLCAREDGALAGVAAVQYLRERWYGVDVRVVQSLTNIESYRYEFVDGGRADVARHLWLALCRGGYADVIRLDHVPEQSATLEIGLAVARESGWRVLTEHTFLTPLRALSTVAWDHGLSAKFKSNLRNRERRLERLGTVAFTVASAEGDVRAAFEMFCRLEASGWKGQCGTSIGQQPDVRRLYDGIIARARDVRIPLLIVSGVPIAAQLVRVCPPTMFLFKTAYDETFAPYAPGQLLTARVVQYAREHGIEVFDFLAENAPWKADWATAFRPHLRLSLFAPTVAGRYGYWARYGVREHVKRVPGVRRFHRWFRHYS